jgi:hypothetical protein
MMGQKLTKAQRQFLQDTVGLGSLGFSADVLSGPTSAMAKRLQAMGLLSRDFIPRVRDFHWQITDAGRAALSSEGRPE